MVDGGGWRWMVESAGGQAMNSVNSEYLVCAAAEWLDDRDTGMLFLEKYCHQLINSA